MPTPEIEIEARKIAHSVLEHTPPEEGWIHIANALDRHHQELRAKRVLGREDFRELFASKSKDELGRFELVTDGTLHPDLRALELIGKLVPVTSSKSLLGKVREDGIELEVSYIDLARNITREEAIILIRCGVKFDQEAAKLVLCLKR